MRRLVAAAEVRRDSSLNSFAFSGRPSQLLGFDDDTLRIPARFPSRSNQSQRRLFGNTSLIGFRGGRRRNTDMVAKFSYFQVFLLLTEIKRRTIYSAGQLKSAS